MKRFFYLVFIFIFPLMGQAQQDCKQQFLDAICYVKDSNARERDASKRVCHPTPAKYVELLSKAYDELPHSIRPTFCHLKRLFIETEFNATGYASPFLEPAPEESTEITDAYKTTGWIIGLNESRVLKSIWSLSEWMNRKEQTLFGIPLEDPLNEVTPKFQIDFEIEDSKIELMVDVLVHETGHLIDFANKINNYDAFNCTSQDFKDCDYLNVSAFALISWTPHSDWREQVKYSEQRPCYYLCLGDDQWKPIDLNEAKNYYSGFLQKGGFISPYASVHPAEDFAESFTFYFQNDSNYTIDFGNGEVYDIFETVKDSPWVRAKTNYVAWLFEYDKHRISFKPGETIYQFPKDGTQQPLWFPFFVD